MDVEGPGGRTAVLLAAAGWLRVEYDILGGLGHDLNGRASALDGLIQILHMEGPRETPVAEYLLGEVARLTELATTVRALSGDVDTPPEAMMPGDVARQAVVLLHKHRSLESIGAEVVVDDGVPPIRVNGAVLLRCLLVLLSAAALEAAGRGLPRVGLAVRGADGPAASRRVRFEVSLPDAPEWDTAALSGRTKPLSELLREVGGSVTVEEERLAVVELPALTRAGAGAA